MLTAYAEEQQSPNFLFQSHAPIYRSAFVTDNTWISRQFFISVSPPLVIYFILWHKLPQILTFPLSSSFPQTCSLKAFSGDPNSRLRSPRRNQFRRPPLPHKCNKGFFYFSILYLFFPSRAHLQRWQSAGRRRSPQRAPPHTSVPITPTAKSSYILQQSCTDCIEQLFQQQPPHYKAVLFSPLRKKPCVSLDLGNGSSVRRKQGFGQRQNAPIVFITHSPEPENSLVQCVNWGKRWGNWGKLSGSCRCPQEEPPCPQRGSQESGRRTALKAPPNASPPQQAPFLPAG